MYTLLNLYDVLLLPTRWKAEGDPGILVEAKMAGLPAIVSNVNYNAEIVEDGVSGIVLRHLDTETLVLAIQAIDRDRDWLTLLKKGALQSAESYIADRYVDEIVSKIY